MSQATFAKELTAKFAQLWTEKTKRPLPPVNQAMMQRLRQGQRQSGPNEVFSRVSALFRDLSLIPQSFENAELQDMAMEILPLDRLYSVAEERAEEEGERDNWGLQDYLIMELLRWFKQDYFTWVNSPPCETCGENGNVQFVRRENSTPEEQKYDASGTEVHQCSNCNTEIRFPRYNDLSKLMETRRGRCGEWAKCFAFFCRALGLRTRYIWNAEDHVWSEVYSERRKEWIHTDSCEEAWNSPTIYSQGWGKKMSYVVGFSGDGVTDVTRRYVRKADQQLPRTMVPDEQFKTILNSITSDIRQNLSPSEKEELKREDEAEERELASYNADEPQEAQMPRQSGSVEWTKARGEGGSDD
ncbi:peptide-N(4)-(N-acetyl-beta-glucosaminyl)asparagine amidase [Yarrowia lipolytica]|uniref:Peptide-N(4)-(N-acetyl-beta-glucosaminyl)asparagine amidase n=2 Tax=Yarrowia lipolytica TaxID=4952 RepID=PNG1_YARLI|nr:YALI0C23562p [Yarrowia lipolytica CLIB122]Q6CAX5.1 RecName: Full=Peptide-N(4)-(N-acetyl-beta-glucosaminyl)asparagine amidase; Short=PNGase; AltName: Full=Peptide:N-glycanase 1 [Yarrowia lipolytica CLIB122]AOW03313.1 hypothetical protein YALI1_C32496g [Yarrowia lipolytica]KAB8280159.1 peptide-N(4)-(N-acetyl-beta-glucosaminyl)asparagine amidase [Yarrowia lipolytica]KAE8170232.1 peptide-N(4)-(N-acetyl-beta-glucosaminyl)asparagine amidase [Yarrowia lipolytica]KAJ8053795.1 peptide-N(4)-(N-acetyl|eukprot:XP_502187.1 YALI0C23562p [Yarrowia lipolytica CLIB122]